MLTRIHAYKLANNKIQFSYAHGSDFLLVGAHYDEEAKNALRREMSIMNLKTISIVFIPEWNEAYCGDGKQFGKLLADVVPTHICIPKWKSQESFENRILSSIQKYKEENPFVDIQYVSDDFKIHDKDKPGRSNNNIVIISKICTPLKTGFYAYRFESSGKWTAILLGENNYSVDMLKSDVVVLPSFDSDELLEMEEAARCLKANIYIKYASSPKQSFWSLLLDGRRLIYNVSRKDVVVTRNTQSSVSCYYFDPNNNLLEGKREYQAE